ncbi:MAG: energy-coupled thiamine transporter ThiT [Clostridia bacterium]|nr:energy-coupled thiamine transporter ThiT [Clostridia bacterium]
MKNKTGIAVSTTQVLAESAVMIALSIALFAVSEMIPWPWAYGGGFTIFGQVPIIIISYRHGLKAGIPAALVLAIFELIMGLKNFSYVTGVGAMLMVALFDYLIAYGVLGMGGMLKKAFENRDTFAARQVPALAIGSLIVCLLRFTCHFISGVTVWSGYAPSSAIKAVILYSLTYNGAYMLIETVITVIGAIAVGSLLDLGKRRISR